MWYFLTWSKICFVSWLFHNYFPLNAIEEFLHVFLENIEDSILYFLVIVRTVHEIKCSVTLHIGVSFILVTYKSILLLPATGTSLNLGLFRKAWSNSVEWRESIPVEVPTRHCRTACWTKFRGQLPAVLLQMTNALPLLGPSALNSWLQGDRERGMSSIF